MAVADNYDAMRSKRPYKPAYSQEETVRLINSESGFRFDPEVIRVFNLKINEIQAIWDQFDK